MPRLLAEFMGSSSTYLPAEFGGHEGRALQTGDKLTVSHRPREAARKIPNGSRHIVLRSRPAPEWDLMTAESQRHLFVSPFIATPETDRMGSRLRGDKIETGATRSMTSSPLLPGTLQVPPDGQPILMLAEGKSRQAPKSASAVVLQKTPPKYSRAAIAFTGVNMAG